MSALSRALFRVLEISMARTRKPAPAEDPAPESTARSTPTVETPALHPDSICFSCQHLVAHDCWLLRRLPADAFREEPMVACSQHEALPTPITTEAADDAAGTEETPA
jgi:hypothetical protein